MSEECILNCSILRNEDSLRSLLLANNCTSHANQTSGISQIEAYGYGFIMILIVSLTSLLGLIILPFVQQKTCLAVAYKHLITLLITMGVAALVSDALLHLIPNALDGDDQANDREDEREVIWKMCGVLGGMVSFFLLELLLHTCFKQLGHTHSHALPAVSDSSLHSDTAALVHESSHETHSPPSDHSASNGELSSSSHYGTVPHTTTTTTDSEGSRWGRKLCDPITNIKPLAWVIIIGDSLHNMTDGLAVGVAISQNLGLGLSTAIAILFHEIPHELSDYAILLHTGMSWYKALFLNFMSTLTAFAGFFIGVAIGTRSGLSNDWLLAVIAGQFLYIALVDLLPEVLHSREKGVSRGIQVVMSFLGLSIGFTVILLIALYEDSLTLSL